MDYSLLFGVEKIYTRESNKETLLEAPGKSPSGSEVEYLPDIRESRIPSMTSFKVQYEDFKQSTEGGKHLI